ncbi:MAG: transposase [Candidatus Absconditabacteria bacterium]
MNYFGKIVDGKMTLNDYGKIAEKFWYVIPKNYMKSQIDYFIIMPNHIHGIIIIENEIYSPYDNPVGNENFRSLHNNRSQHNNPHHKTNLSNIIKGFKIGCTKEIKNNYNDNGFGWQKSFYDVIIRNDEQLEKIRQYIIDNPMKGE